ncbi:MAG: YicC family protein [Acidobacteria bacterium]|nr:YicC family protein [Acidobacteriota bacterium]
MIKSMTGYGRAHSESDDFTVDVVVSSVNHRFLDLQLRMPEELGAWESSVRKLVQAHCERGRLNLNISFEGGRGGNYQVNRSMVASVLAAVDQLKRDFHLSGEVDVNALLQLPKIVQPATSSVDDLQGLYEQIERTLKEALEGLVNMRVVEGRELGQELNKRLDFIADGLREIESESGALVENARLRLHRRLEEMKLNVQIDENRLGQEIALMAQRSDITEEITRLKSHIEQFRGLLEGGKPVGKKLDFLLQEMNREANTILSKAQGLLISRSAVQIRSEIEKLREQVQNVE